jgi:hypothetical protein
MPKKNKPTGSAGYEARSVIKKIDQLRPVIDDLKHGSSGVLGLKIDDLSPEVFSADIMRDMKDVVGRMNRVRREVHAKNNRQDSEQDSVARRGDEKN